VDSDLDIDKRKNEVIDTENTTTTRTGEGGSETKLDAFSTEGFLKLIENQGVSGIETIYHQKLEPILYGRKGRDGRCHGDRSRSQHQQQHNGRVVSPDNDQGCHLQVSLLPHQIHGVCWMYQMENLDNHDDVGDNNNHNNNRSNINPNSNNNNASLGLNGLLWERRQFREGDVYYYSPALGQARLHLTIGNTTTDRVGRGGGGRRRKQQQRRRRINRGGILADEMGLGKTVQAVALIVATLDELRNQQHTNSATLIIVPPALIGQWMNEIKKIAGDNLVVQFLDHKEQQTKKTKELGDTTVVILDPNADIVLTTYQALDGKGNKNHVASKGKGMKKRTAARMRALAVSNILLSTIWGRIVLDEMQEVRSWTTSISKQCEQLQSDRRWMLSGTPLWEGIQDFRGELCFLGLEPFAANNEDGFFDFAITNHWDQRSTYGLDILRILSLVMLRRTKSMNIIDTGMPLLGLKNLTVVFEPVPQDPSERALYCFLESVMHTTLLTDNKSTGNGTNNNNNTKQQILKNQQNKLIFLRLLRELCVSPVLINGGLGCSSQLATLNRLLKEYNRRRLNTTVGGTGQDTTNTTGGGTGTGQNNNTFPKTYSCDEAVQFLSQVEDVARTDSQFVTNMVMGGGGGVSRRNRATLIDPQERIQQAKNQISKSTTVCNITRSSRAKARWHLALEGVTTGQLEGTSCYNGISRKILKLWVWRKNVPSSGTLTNNNSSFFSRMIRTINPKSSSRTRRIATQAQAQVVQIPSFLTRGFRPTAKYFGLETGNETENEISQKYQREEKLKCLYNKYEFRWSHPFALVFSNIPIQISKDELQESLGDLVLSQRVKIYHLRVSKDSKTWTAALHLSNKEDYARFYKEATRTNGIQLQIEQPIPCIEQEIADAKDFVTTSKYQCDVYPCSVNERNLAKAKIAYKKAKLGLCALVEVDHHKRPSQVLCSRAFGNFRGVTPLTSVSLIKDSKNRIEAATRTLTKELSIIHNEERVVTQLEKKANNVSNKIKSLNTFDALQALKNGDDENTSCSICLDTLGAGDGSDGMVLLTRCGHMACRSCLQRWMDDKEQRRATITCIECRKPIVRNNLICVDPKKVDYNLGDNTKKAKLLVQEAAVMLKENFGQLDPHLWDALYLAIDLPVHISKELHPACTAIPGLLLGHLRHVMDGVPLHSAPTQTVTKDTLKLSSKLRALLTDLPRDELSVVFASSKSIVLHIQHILQVQSIKSSTLYVGQSEFESECAIRNWENEKNDTLVLIVQAGAAACGLTLTASCKMFIMEPFRKHEEEKQAYARLHRYGQKHAVECKVYYTPVTVESRLLEWRRRATNTHASEEEKTVYAPLRTNKGDDDDDDDDDMLVDESDDNSTGKKDGEAGNNNDVIEEENQTRFLLGLSSSSRRSDTTTNTTTRLNNNMAAGLAQQNNTNESENSNNHAEGTAFDPILL